MRRAWSILTSEKPTLFRAPSGHKVAHFGAIKLMYDDSRVIPTLDCLIGVDLELSDEGIEHWTALNISKRHGGDQPSGEVRREASLEIEDIFHHKLFVH